MIRIVDVDNQIEELIELIGKLSRRPCGHIECTIHGRRLDDILDGQPTAMALIDAVIERIGSDHGFVLALRYGLSAIDGYAPVNVHEYGRSRITEKLSIVLSSGKAVCP